MKDVSTKTGSLLGRLTLLGATVILVCVPAFATVYVDIDNVSGTETGTSWATAFTTIQAGVDAAYTAGGGEVWVAQGTYVGTGTNVVEMKTGVSVYGGFKGTETLLSQRKVKTYVTTVDGEDTRRCALFSGVTATLDGLTIIRGKSTNGGGVLAESSVPSVKNCTFENNTADYGAALDIYANTATCRIESNIFQGNTAYAGAGIRFRACPYTISISNTFESNTADEGAAVLISESSLTVSKTQFTGNTATAEEGRGGIICCVGTPSAGIYSSFFERNAGVCIVTDETSPWIQNCAFHGNSDTVIENNASSPTIEFCTLAWNHSMEGGIVSDSSSSPTISSCILWRNGPTEIVDYQKTTTVTYSCVRGGYAGEGNISSSPCFVDGLGGDLRLCPVSPCLDEASATYPTRDMRQTLRPQGTGADMGAYEMVSTELTDTDGDGMVNDWETAQGLNPGVADATGDPDGDGLTNLQEYQQGENVYFDGLYVNTTNTAGPWDGQSWATAYQTIQEAVDEAYSLGGGDVWVAAGTYTGTGDQVVMLRSAVNVYGGFSGDETTLGQRDPETNTTAIDGQNTRRCVRGSDNAILDGFTVTQGRGVNGGGMYNYSASPTVRYCTFTLNQSTGQQTNGGAAMFNSGGSPTISYCTFTGNTAASYGGGIMNSAASPQISHCTFTGNTAAWYGGAIANVSSSPTIEVCEFIENIADSTLATGGGAVLNSASSPSFTNCVFCGNSADVGAAICNQAASSPQWMNCTIAGNAAGSETGGAVYNTGACSPQFTNCILWNENTQEVHNNGSAETPSLTYCVVQGGFSGAGNIDSNPLLKNVANNDCRLKGGSPCLDAGTSTNAPAVDLSGVSRPFNVPGVGAESPAPTYDIGAYEYNRTTGTVAIWTTPSTAPWSYIDGDGDTHTGTGTVIQSGIPIGTILVSWESLANYDTPEQPAAQTLTAGGTVYFVANYTRHLGTVAVNVTPEGAPWSFVDGDGATHSGSGDSSIPGVPTGDIVMTWGTVSLYDAPASQTLALTKNATVTFTGTYTRQLGTVIVNVTPDNAPWSFTDGDGGTHTGTGDSSVPSIPTGTITLSWLEVSNYTAPANPAAQTLTKNGTVTFVGSYARHTGTVVVQVTPSTALWRVTDADGGVHDGTGSTTLPAIPTGAVEIAWLPTTNYTQTVSSASDTLAKDATVTFTATYIRNTGTVIVNVSPDTAPWSFTDGDGAAHTGTGDATVTSIPTGTITLTWLSLLVYDAPATPSAQTLDKDASVTFAGTYTRQPRRTFYVNADNTSGVEDGSSQHPFNTIGEAVNASVATRGDSIRVYAGAYGETIQLKESTTLLGVEGSYNTTIGGTKVNASPLTVADDCIVRGFTVTGNSDCAVRFAQAAEAEMTNCVVLGGHSGVIVGEEAVAVLLNNTILNAESCGIECESLASVTILRNNIIMGCGSGVCADANVVPSRGYNVFYQNDVDYDGPDPDDTDVNTNPLFVAASSQNYHLTNDSPCRNAGDPALEYNDLDNSRNDVGADGGPYGVRDLTAPHAVIATTPTPAEAALPPLTVVFSGSGTTDEWGIASYSWDFDAVDGIQADATDASAEYEYTESGTYTVTLTVQDNSGNPATTTATVFVGQAPTAAAAATPLAGPAPLIVHFTGTGEDPDGGDVSYAWDFGNGADSSLQSPVYSYPAGTAAGAYPVALTVSDEDGVTAQSHIKITITETAVLAAASIDPTDGGTLTVADSSSSLNGVSVTVPSGAISDSVVLAVCEAPAALPALPEGTLAGAIDLAPSGLLLSQPITVHIPHPASLEHEATVRAFYYDSESGQWSEEGITNVRHVVGASDHAIEFETTHLSVYAAEVVEVQNNGGCGAGTLDVSMPQSPFSSRHFGDVLMFALMAGLLAAVSFTRGPARQ